MRAFRELFGIDIAEVLTGRNGAGTVAGDRLGRRDGAHGTARERDPPFNRVLPPGPFRHEARGRRHSHAAHERAPWDANPWELVRGRPSSLDVPVEERHLRD